MTFAYAMNSHASAELDIPELLSCFRVLPRSRIPRVIDFWAQIFKSQNEFSKSQKNYQGSNLFG